MKKYFILLLLIHQISTVNAQKKTWTGTAGTSWNTSSNWSPSGVPSRCDSVIIPSTTNKPTLSSNVKVSTISLGSNLTINNNYTLTFTELDTTLSTTKSVVGSSPFPINGLTYQQQSANKPYSIKVYSSACKPIYRMQVIEGDEWSGETNFRNRAELYNQGNALPMESDVWLSYALLIEEGDNIIYTDNPDNIKLCVIGQAHANEDPATSSRPRDASNPPAFGFSLFNQGDIQLLTTGNTSVITPDVESVLRASTTITPKEWHYFVVRVKFSKGSQNGQIQWWVDGKEICNLSNILIGFNDLNGPYWKFGIYRYGSSTNLAIQYANMEIKNGTNALVDRIENPKIVN